jgi:hypothetical protein
MEGMGETAKDPMRANVNHKDTKGTKDGARNSVGEKPLMDAN